MWIKILRQRKLQTVMIILITAVCTTLLAGAISILSSLQKPSRDFIKKSNSVTAKFYPYTDKEEEIAAMGRQFAELPNVKSVELVRKHNVDENIYFAGKKEDQFVNLTEYHDHINGRAIYLEGVQGVGKTLKDNECILPACISSEYHLHIGGTVTIRFSNEVLTYKVKAVYTDPYQTSTAFDSDILIKKLPDIDSHIVINVYGKDNITGGQIEEAYREKYDGLMNASMLSAEDRMSNGLVVGRIIGALFFAVGIIMLLVSALMIRYMIKNAMIADAKSIAVYKTIGYTSNYILSMYLKLYFTIITLACIIGALCSTFFSDIVLQSIFKNMGQLKMINSFLSGFICYLVVVSFVLLVIYVNIAKARRIKPVQALNGEDYGGIRKKKNYKGNSGLLFSPFGIAYRTFIRDKRSAVKIIITCMVTVFSVNFIVISFDIANTMKENNDFWLGIDKSDVIINVVDPSDYNYIKQVAEQDKRTDNCLNSINQVLTVMKWEKGMASSEMDSYVYDDYKRTKLPVTEGRNPEAFNEIAISVTMAKELHKDIGDYIEVYLYGEHKANLLITGLFQTFLQFGRMCRVTTDALKEHGCTYSYNTLSVFLKDRKDEGTFIRDIRDKIGKRGNVKKRTEQYSSIMDMIEKPQQKAIPPLAALILLIAGLNIFSMVYLKNLKMQKINSIYKCLGYTALHLIISNLVYIAVISLFCIITVMPISLITYTPIMKLCLSILNFTQYPMQINKVHLFIANTAVLLIFMINTLFSSRSLLKVNARDLVQD